MGDGFWKIQQNNIVDKKKNDFYGVLFNSPLVRGFERGDSD
jgi:hypothetical protein